MNTQLNSNQKNNPSSVCIRFARNFLGIITLSLILFFVIGEIFFPDERDTIKTDCRIFETDWYQILENGETIPVAVPGKVPAKYDEVVTLTTTLPNHIVNGETLCFHTIWQDVSVSIDGELRSFYTTENSRPFGNNSAFRYVFTELRESDAGKQLQYNFSSNSKYTGDMRRCLIGDRTSIWLFLAKESGTRAIVSTGLLMVSLFCIITCIILRVIYKKHLTLSYLAWTVFFAAIWMLSEVSFRQLIFKNVSVFSGFTYWSLMLFPIPLILYINETQKGYYEKLFLLPLIYSVLIFVFGTALQIFEIVQFVDILLYIHIGDALTILFIIFTITFDTIKHRIKDYLFVGIGIYGLLLSAVLEIALYYISSTLSLGTMLAFGLFFLLIMAIIKTGQDLLLSEKKKQKAISARQAQAKFLANMSHEIRTPLNAVIGMNEMILRETSDETVLEYAHNIQSASNMLLGLVNDVLDFSKIESGKIELVENTYSLSALTKDLSILLNNRIGEKPLTAHQEIDTNLPDKLFGDELRIKQILINLLSNAVKYTKEGSITLKVFSEALDSGSVILCFSVTDTGSGIRKEDLPKLFYSFKRLELNKNRNIEGTGLGLNIAKQLAELMGGTITVESEYGKGSVFTLSIPQKIMDNAPISALAPSADNVSEKVKSIAGDSFIAPAASILIVDDNAMNLTLTKGLLKRTKVQVDLAKSGAECLALTKKKSYHMILLDHMMPELDGIETLQLLRADEIGLNRNTPAIALTANAIAGCREMYLDYGFHDYFSKPIQVDKLDALLLKYLPPELIILQTKTDSEA